LRRYLIKEFEIWSEGHGDSPAHLIGEAFGETFFEACENFRYPEDYRNRSGEIVSFKGQSLAMHRNQDQTLRIQDGQPKYNMCRLYDNEAEAPRHGYKPPKPRRRR